MFYLYQKETQNLIRSRFSLLKAREYKSRSNGALEVAYDIV
jgi:hypothetical protein